jgi:hypothetical protein
VRHPVERLSVRRYLASTGAEQTVAGGYTLLRLRNVRLGATSALLIQRQGTSGAPTVPRAIALRQKQRRGRGSPRCPRWTKGRCQVARDRVPRRTRNRREAALSGFTPALIGCVATGVSAETPDVVGEEASARGGGAVLTPARARSRTLSARDGQADLRGDHLSRRPRCERAGHFRVG